MRVEKQCVSENGVGTEDADLVRPLDRGLAVAPDHLLDLENALRDMHRERNAAFAGGIAAVAQQLRSAVFDLHRRDDAGESAAR